MPRGNELGLVRAGELTEGGREAEGPGRGQPVKGDS